MWAKPGRFHMIEVPASWQRLILTIREQDPKAIIAGGAVRDLILGRKPKDLDIFVSVRAHTLAVMRPSGYSWGFNAYHDALNSSAFRIRNIYQSKWRGIIQPLQSIELEEMADDPLTLIENFDFGICMAAYDGKEIIRSRHFDHDVEHKVFTLRHCRSLVKSKQRWKRITKRYRSGWWVFGRRWPMELSGKARLDIMIQKLEAKGRLRSPDLSGFY